MPRLETARGVQWVSQYDVRRLASLQNSMRAGILPCLKMLLSDMLAGLHCRRAEPITCCTCINRANTRLSRSLLVLSPSDTVLLSVNIAHEQHGQPRLLPSKQAIQGGVPGRIGLVSACSAVPLSSLLRCSSQRPYRYVIADNGNESQKLTISTCIFTDFACLDAFTCATLCHRHRRYHVRHSIYIAQYGKPDGKPVVFIHGG